MLLTVTPNPAVDRTAVVGTIATDTVLRPEELTVLPGGKGVNVARAAKALGAIVATSGLAGGHGGRWLVEALEREGLNPRFATTAGETRTTYVVIDRRGRSVLLYEPGPPASRAELEALLTLLSRELLPIARSVVVAGSLPSGLPPATFARLVAACHAAGRPCLVDTAGPPLLAALEERPEVVKISLEEGRESRVGGARADAREVARTLVAAGAGLAVVTQGSRGAAAFDGQHGWDIAVPAVRALDPIGSGDAVSAGLAVALLGGAETPVALARAVAAGTANALTIGAGRLDAGLAAELVSRVEVRPWGRSSLRG